MFGTAERKAGERMNPRNARLAKKTKNIRPARKRSRSTRPMRSRVFPRRKPLTQMRSCRRSSFHVEGNSRPSIPLPPPRAEVVPVTAGSPAEREEDSEGRSAMANPLPLNLPALESKGILQGEGEAKGTACPYRRRGEGTT